MGYDMKGASSWNTLAAEITPQWWIKERDDAKYRSSRFSLHEETRLRRARKKALRKIRGRGKEMDTPK